MLRLGWRACRLAVLAVSLTAIVPGIGFAHGKPRADLKVTKGSVSAANGQLDGSFVVRNKGAAKAKGSKAALVVRADGKAHEAKRFKVRSLRRSAKRTVKVAAGVPAGLPVGTWPIQVCADVLGKVRERSERNNCRQVGTIEIAAEPLPPVVPVSTVPANPVPFSKNVAFTLNSPQNDWVYVPTAYDATHATPMTLFVWLHGCRRLQLRRHLHGQSRRRKPGLDLGRRGGREGACWNVNTDGAKVLAAIADIKTHFNINPRRVILGGYSSGGDLTYRTAFYNSSSFAGVLVVNSSPFRDTGSSQSASLAAATSKFQVVHLAHLQDATYPIAGVRSETDAMVSAGFPLVRVEVDGGHYNDPGDIENGHTVPGTNADVSTYLLSHIDDGWLSP